jgi:hypothetical protein
MELKYADASTSLLNSFPYLQGNEKEGRKMEVEKKINETNELFIGRDNVFVPKNVKIIYANTENWTKHINLHAKVYKVTKTEVYCDCIIDRENQIFEKRIFPLFLFEGIENVRENTLVYLKIRQKQGAMRIDVIDGRGIVSPSEFSLEDKWNSLKGF